MKLIVAATSARALAEMARRSGFEVVALDVFGDSDTRAAASHWQAIGNPATLEIDPLRLREALAAHAPGAVGWVPGSGLERLAAWPSWPALPLLGARGPTAAPEWLAALRTLGLPHPEAHAAPPPALQGWLRKDLASCGGAAVVRASGQPGGASVYWQREAQGQPVSLTFIANGQQAIGLGINRQHTCALAPGRPFGHAGISAPQPVPDAVAAGLLHMAQALTRHFGLRGLAGLDALWHGESVALLELNARVPASAALYPEAPLMAWHVVACVRGELPPAVRPGFALPVPATPRGQMLVAAPEAGVLDAPLLRAWAARPGVHDVARAEDAPLSVAGGAPLCTVSAEGLDMQQQLAAAHAQCINDWRAHHAQAGSVC